MKKIALTEFSRPRSSGIIALNLRDEDELIGVDITDGSNEIMLFSSQGRVVRFAESAVRAMGRLATGVRGIKLALTNDIAERMKVRSKLKTFLTIMQKKHSISTSIKSFP